MLVRVLHRQRLEDETREKKQVVRSHDGKCRYRGIRKGWMDVLRVKKTTQTKLPCKIWLSTESANVEVVNAGVKACGRTTDIWSTPLIAVSASAEGDAFVVMSAIAL